MRGPEAAHSPERQPPVGSTARRHGNADLQVGTAAMHRGMLVHRHLRPMLEAGVLELKYPDRPSSPRQAYRARRIGAAQSN